MSKWHGMLGSPPDCVNVCPLQVGSHVCGEPAHASALSASLTWYGGSSTLVPSVSAPGTPTKMVFTGPVAAVFAAWTREMIDDGYSQSGHMLPSSYPGRVDSDAHEAPP